MKKVYLSIIFCLCAFVGFSATWYSNPSGGNAANPNNWWSLPGGTGTHPSGFTAASDTFIIQNDMTCNSDLNIGGYLTINNADFKGPAGGTLTIGRDLRMTGGAIMDETPPDGSVDMTINLSGNLYVLDTSSFNNIPANTVIVFNNDTSSTLLSPQTITWTSTVPGSYTTFVINANCFVQLLSNVNLPFPTEYSDIVNGSLVCGNYVLDCYTHPFDLNDGASFYTANPYGIDSSVRCLSGFSYSASANYIFNGTIHQATGLLMPNEFASGGSVTVNNAAGVTLSQSTTFDDGSGLTLANGSLTIRSAELNFGVAASLTGASSTRMIITNGTGMLQKQFSDDGSFLYPIGDSALNYSPVSISVTGSEYAPAAYIGANVTHLKQPNNHNINNFLKRYWSVTAVGVTGLSYTIDSARYVAGDVVGTEANISMGQFISILLPWVKFGPTNALTHTLSSTAVNNSSSDFTGISTAAPTISIPHNIPLCNGDTATISVTVAADTPFTYSWSPATSLSSTTGSSVMTSTTSNITYTVTVTDANGFTATDTTAITVNPKPNVYTVTGGGPYCSGTGGVHIGMNTSDTGIHYQLFRHDTATGSFVAGTGFALDFGLETAVDTYTVVATNAPGCFSNMAGNAIVTVTPSPVIDTVTGGGSYCSGASGVHVRLSGSTAGISYQLNNGLSPADTAVTGTGSSIDFGLYTNAGTYTVVATNTVNACTSNMKDSAKVIVNPLPAFHSITVAGSGHYCPYAIDSIGLNGSDTGVRYQLYLNDTGARGSAVAGTGSPLHFGNDTVTGVYTIVATNATTGCTRNMLEGASIVILPVVIPSVSIESSLADTICINSTVTLTADAVNAGGEPGYQWSVNGSTVGSGLSYSYIPLNGDVVRIRLISGAACPVPDTVTDSMTMLVIPLETPTITLSAAPGDTVCKGTSVFISAATTFGGHEPTYTWVKNAVVTSYDSFYAYVPTNEDNIYCVMESDYFCLATTTAYSNVINMTVEAPVVPSVSIIAFPSTIIHTGKPDSLVAVVANGGVNPSYQWYVNNTRIDTATTASFSQSHFTDRDSVSVQVTRRDACHLSNFTSVVLAVNNLDVKQAASAGSGIKLVPNPNRGTFIIAGSLGTFSGSDEQVSIEITDMLGQVVYRAKVVTQNGEINDRVQMDSALPNGIYLLNLKSGGGVNTIRFVIGQ